jgi:hypothetical protein
MRRRLTLVLLALAATSGCGGGAASLPSGSEARNALQTALDAWKDGKPASALVEGKPPVQAVDHDWVAGKGLDAYVIGDEQSGDGNKTFTVSITLKGSSAPSDVRYMIFGRDPIRVYRDDDFTRMTNMEDNPAQPKPN